MVNPNERAPEAVLLHPPVSALFSCIEHAAGELAELGDALGIDCTVVRVVDGWPRAHSGDGASNDDWYGWRELLLAPLASVVEKVRANSVVNKPGTLGKPPAASITFLTEDGLRVMYAHVQDVGVLPGQHVEAGQSVARIGNNGMSRCPHVHIGAWRGGQPLPIRFDLMVLGRLRLQAKEH